MLVNLAMKEQDIADMKVRTLFDDASGRQGHRSTNIFSSSLSTVG